jgi:hypothetical protein
MGEVDGRGGGRGERQLKILPSLFGYYATGSLRSDSSLRKNIIQTWYVDQAATSAWRLYISRRTA